MSGLLHCTECGVSQAEVWTVQKMPHGYFATRGIRTWALTGQGPNLVIRCPEHAPAPGWQGVDEEADWVVPE